MAYRRCGALVLVLWLAVGLVAALVGGCGTTVVHPPADVADPVTVRIADYGRHSSLLLPREDGTTVEWAYGEWRWFAAGEDSLWRAPGVLLGTHPGALGKRELGPLDLDGEGLKKAIGLEAVHELGVERAKVAALLGTLDVAFAAGEAQKLFNPKNGLTFVPDAREYSSDFHCNTVVAQWLRELGCEVGPASFVADFRVEGAQAPTRGGEGQ